LLQLRYLETRLATVRFVRAWTQAHLKRQPLAKPNYNQAKRQKENARKARQQEKLAKKLARVAGDPEVADATADVATDVASDAAPAPAPEPKALP
jgi:hypothetical protein